MVRMLALSLLLTWPLLLKGGCPYLSKGSSFVVESAAPSAEVAEDPLVKLNDEFHSLYAVARVAARPPLLLVALGNNLILLRTNATGDVTRTVVGPGLKQPYHELKVVSHIPLAAYIALQAPVQTWEQTLPRLYERIEMAEGPLAERLIGLESIFGVVEKTKALIQAVLHAPSSAEAKLRALLREIRPQLDLALEEAVKVQIETTVATLDKLKEQLSEAEWAQMKCVVPTSFMARPGNPVGQLFRRYFAVNGTAEHNERFFISEGFSQKASIQNAETHVLDSQIGRSFFGDTYRMWRDVMADPAADVLDQRYGPLQAYI